MKDLKVNRVDFANKVVTLIEEKDKALDAIFKEVDAKTQLLLEKVSSAEKYEVIVGIEYLLVRARIQLEFEHISVKKILSDPEVTQSLRNIFLKRDQYLAQVSMKLTTLRDDISNLQKVVYTNSNFIKK